MLTRIWVGRITKVMEKVKEPRVSLSSHFTYKKIFWQVITPILMMVFTSIYGIVDGFFVSNFDSEDAFAGVNLIFPLVILVGGIAYMFGSGGCALVSKFLGEKKREEACQVFTMLIIVLFIVGIVLSVGGFFLIKPAAIAMAKVTADISEAAVEKAISYGRILMLGQSVYMLQSVFQNFFVADEKQNLGFVWTVAAGVTNIVFDALFVGLLGWNVEGAAIATILGYLVGSVGPVIYFFVKKDGLLTFVKTKIRFKPIIKSITNGFSDFIFNVSSSIVSICYNVMLLKYFGQNGLSAYGVTMYVSFFFVAIFIGYVIGMGPVIAYNYGAQNHHELKNVVKRSFIVLGAASITMFVLSTLLARPLSMLFLSSTPDALELSVRYLRIYSISFLMAGVCIFITSLFTSLNNGLISGLTSLFRTLVFQIATIFLLPLIFNSGEALLWAAAASELLSIIVSLAFYFAFKKKYHY